MPAPHSRVIQALDHFQSGEGQQFTAPYGQGGQNAGLLDPGLGDGIAAFVSADPGAYPHAHTILPTHLQREPVESRPIGMQMARPHRRGDEIVAAEEPGRVGIAKPDAVEDVGLEASYRLSRHDLPLKLTRLALGQEGVGTGQTRRQVWRERLARLLQGMLAHCGPVRPPEGSNDPAEVSGQDDRARLKSRAAQVEQVAAQRGGIEAHRTLSGFIDANNVAHLAERDASGRVVRHIRLTLPAPEPRSAA